MAESSRIQSLVRSPIGRVLRVQNESVRRRGAFTYISNREIMAQIQRFGESARWSDIVIYRGEARWVEVADDASADARGQIAQVLSQIDETLERIQSRRTDLLQVLIFLADLNDSSILNELWDEWVPVGHPPVRACVEARLSPGYYVEMVISAVVADTFQDK